MLTDIGNVWFVYRLGCDIDRKSFWFQELVGLHQSYWDNIIFHMHLIILVCTCLKYQSFKRNTKLTLQFIQHQIHSVTLLLDDIL